MAQGDQTYTVKAGDNLSKISKLFYGDANQYPKIAKANNLPDPDKIKVGPVSPHPRRLIVLSRSPASAGAFFSPALCPRELAGITLVDAPTRHT